MWQKLRTMSFKLFHIVKKCRQALISTVKKKKKNAKYYAWGKRTTSFKMIFLKLNVKNFVFYFDF